MVNDQTFGDDGTSPLVNPDVEGLDGDGDISGLDPDLLAEDDSVLDEDPAGWN